MIYVLQTARILAKLSLAYNRKKKEIELSEPLPNNVRLANLHASFGENKLVEAVVFSKILIQAIQEGTVYVYDLELKGVEDEEAIILVLELLARASRYLPIVIYFHENLTRIRFDADYLSAVLEGDKKYEKETFHSLPDLLVHFFTLYKKFLNNHISHSYFLRWISDNYRIDNHLKMSYMAQFLAPHERFILFYLLHRKLTFSSDSIMLRDEFFLDELYDLGFNNLQFSKSFTKFVDVHYDDFADLEGFSLKRMEDTLKEFADHDYGGSIKVLMDTLFTETYPLVSKIGLQVHDDHLVGQLYTMADELEFKALYINVLKGISAIKNEQDFSEFLNQIQLDVKYFLEESKSEVNRVIFICGLTTLLAEISSFQKKKLLKCIKSLLELKEKSLKMLLAIDDLSDFQLDKAFFIDFPDEDVAKKQSEKREAAKAERYELLRYKSFLRVARLEELRKWSK